MAKKSNDKVAEKSNPKVLTIPLVGAYSKRRTRRSQKAVKEIRSFLTKHLKKPFVLDPTLNDMVWDKGMQKPPRNIRVKIVEEDGQVVVSPADKK